jgi:hypothetical protein
MAADEVHVGDVGTTFILTVTDGTAVDVSGATTKQILFGKPNGSTVTKTAAFTTDGTDGKVQYSTVANDLDMAGVWNIQAYVVLAAGSWHSDVTSFVVYPNVA